MGTTANRYVRRKRQFKKKPWYKRKYNALQLAEKAVKGVYYLKGLVNSEKKYWNVVNTGTVNWAGSYAYLLTQVPQGDTNVSRDGNSLFARSLYIKGIINLDTTVANSMVKLLVCIDKNDTDVTTVTPFTSICEGALLNSAQAPLCNLNRQNLGRFKILFSRMFTLSNTGQSQVPFKIYLPMRHHIRFGDGVGVLDRGQISLYAVSDQNGAGNPPTVAFNSRLSFHDN